MPDRDNDRRVAMTLAVEVLGWFTVLDKRGRASSICIKLWLQYSSIPVRPDFAFF